MPRLKTRSLALVLGTGLIATYLTISFLNYRSSQIDVAGHNVLSALRQIYNANQSVLPTQSTVILEPSPGLTCQDGGAGLYLLFIVISSPDNVARRDVLRTTFHEMRQDWETQFFNNSSINMGSGNTTKLFQMLFFVGQTAENGISDGLRSEWERHGDVIVDDMQESYLNLTVKTLRMLKWALHNCAEANYLVKMDDDVYLNVPKLLTYLSTNGSPLLVAGHRYNEVKVDRDPTSKWYTPPGLWHREKFPVFVAGFCYIMGMKAAAQMFAESRHVPLFHLEDVFLSGIVGTERLNLELSQFGEIITMLEWYHYLKPISWVREKSIIHLASSNQIRCWTRYTTTKELEEGSQSKNDSGDWWPLLLYYCL
ncbi:Beta-1,3-galactosyltransferase 5 [Orchesella cincta]|uniref:Hexosyltransferase n=1 Tax=Orchesella cincta TaxID=48709 RepID=A0A1D2MUJ4_ORCCI|nr:Beta-1,3-galactosyltransferase 5 [Orchesella cincta]